MVLPLLLGACQGPAIWERVLLMHPGAWAQQVNNQRGEAWGWGRPPMGVRNGGEETGCTGLAFSTPLLKREGGEQELREGQKQAGTVPLFMHRKLACRIGLEETHSPGRSPREPCSAPGPCGQPWGQPPSPHLQAWKPQGQLQGCGLRCQHPSLSTFPLRVGSSPELGNGLSSLPRLLCAGPAAAL